MSGPEEKAERYQKVRPTLALEQNCALCYVVPCTSPLCWLQALVALVSEIQRKELTPLYKEGFLCAARCCDSQTPEAMQAW